HHRLHKTLGVQTFFCDPHSPWQKGGVENSIGLLRRSLPRKTDLKSVTAAALKRHVHRLNKHPTQMSGLQDAGRGILQTQFNCCTSNVTPSPGFRRDDLWRQLAHDRIHPRGERVEDLREHLAIIAARTLQHMEGMIGALSQM